MPADRLLRDLASQVSPSHVLARPADLAAYAWDAYGASGDRHLPDAVVFPRTTDEVAGVVQVCGHHQTPVIPRGAGTGYSGGATALHGGVILNLARMHRVLGVEPEALRLHAEAGAITAEVQRRAAHHRLRFAPDPGSASTCTIGGNVACNASGPGAYRYGSTADYLVGATAVLADGRTARIGEGGHGGDLFLRLLPGSEGTLAVITEALLRLIPAPTTRATLAAVYPDMAAAVGATAAIASAGIVPSALEVLDDAALAAVARAGVDVIAPGAGALILVELEGEALAVSADIEAVRSALERGGATHVMSAADETEAQRLWTARKAVSAAVAAVMVGKVNEDVCVPRDRVAELVSIARMAGASQGVPTVTFGHLGDAVIHVTFLMDPRIPGERARADAAAAQVAEAAVGIGGSITAEHGTGHVKVPHMGAQLGADTLALMARLKASLDPVGILNPGTKLALPVASTGPAPQAAGTALHHAAASAT